MVQMHWLPPGERRQRRLLLALLWMGMGGWLLAAGARPLPAAPPPGAFTLVGRYATQAGGAVAVDGSYAYVGDYTSLKIVNVSTPSAPTLVGSLALAEYVHEIQVAGSYAYLANGLNGLKIIDVSNPAAPSVVGSMVLDDPVVGLHVVPDGTTTVAYLATQFGGVQVIDITNPTAPIATGVYRTTTSAEKIQIVDGYAYVAANTGGLVILTAQSAQPELVGTYDTAGTALHVRMRSGVAYLADGNAGVVSLSVADPSRPTLLGRYDTPNGAQYLRLAQGQLYVADSGSLLALNIAAPSHLTLAASVTLEPASALIQLQIVGDLIYVGDLHSGLYVVRRKPAAFITQYVYLPQLQRH